MLSYITGKIVSCSPTKVLIETQGGLGISIHITISTYETIKEKSDCKLYTHLHIKKDGQVFSGYDIYGFNHESDKNMFELLLSVSGVGANTARLMLNNLSHSEIVRAIQAEDERTLSSTKGLGPKTAKRVILDLKDKVSKLDSDENINISSENNLKEEALLALMSLGFQKGAVMKVLNKISSDHKVERVEDYIKLALKSL